MNLFDMYRERSAARLKYQSENGLLQLPPTPKGKEMYAFRVGQTVTASGKGAIRAGVRFKIEQREKVNGFCRYYGAGMWHRSGDIEK